MTKHPNLTSEALVLHASAPKVDFGQGESRGERVRRYRAPTLRRETRAMPDQPKPGWVRLQPAFVGICGSDLHLLETIPPHDEIRFSAPISIQANGRIIGHEGVAKVVAISPGSDGFKVGDWVVPASIYHCGRCASCEKGFKNQCDSATLLGAQIDGLFAEQLDLDSKLLLNVTDHIKRVQDLVAMTSLEPSSTALQACELAGLGVTSRVLIFGAGPIGAYSAMIAKEIFQCSHVSIVEPAQKRRALVSSWVNDLHATLAELMSNDSAMQSFDAVIEASGHLDNINQIFPRIQANGRVIVLARSGEPLVLSHVDHMITKGITIQGCRGQLGGYMDRVATWYSQGRLPLGALVDQAGKGLDDLSRLLHNPRQLRESYCKAVVKLNESLELAG